MQPSVCVIAACVCVFVYLNIYFVLTTTQLKPTSDDDDVDGVDGDDVTMMKSFDNHLAMIFTESDASQANNDFLRDKFRRSISSIIKNADTRVFIHLIVDENSQKSAKAMIDEAKQLVPSEVEISFDFHQIDRLTQPLEFLLPSLKSHFTYKSGSYYSRSFFFLSLILHRLLTDIDKIVLVDIDIKLDAPLSQLFDHFNHFQPDSVIGLAFEQQPVYRHLLNDYRQRVGNITRFGSPPPHGLPGFNSGVVLLHLEKMRQSLTYNSLLKASVIDELANKYRFRGHLGDQDFYTLISLDYEQLFYVLPCEWNRQLCQWWRYHGYADVFDDYHRCSNKIKLFHGNCNSALPGDAVVSASNRVKR